MPSPRAREEFRLENLHEPISHYTDAVRFGNLLFISGCTGTDEDGRITSEDVAEQTRQVFRNIGDILTAAHASFDDVLKVTVYLLDIDDRPLINPIRQEVFGDSRPASVLVQVSRLAIPGAKVEIDAVAGLNSTADENGRT